MNEGSDGSEFSSVQFVIVKKRSSLGMQNNQESILVQACARFSTKHFQVFLGQISLCNLSRALNLHLP